MCSQIHCPECSSPHITHHRVRVDHADPSITVCVMVTCVSCGATR